MTDETAELERIADLRGEVMGALERSGAGPADKLVILAHAYAEVLATGGDFRITPFLVNLTSHVRDDYATARRRIKAAAGGVVALDLFKAGGARTRRG